MLLFTHASPDGRLALDSRPPRAQLVARVRILLPHLREEHSQYQTAFLFAASRWTPIVDRLARFTGFPREFVALRARRWADHGLWTEGGDEDRALDSDRLAHAVEVGEGRVQLALDESADEDSLPLPGWVAAEDWAQEADDLLLGPGPSTDAAGEVRSGDPNPSDPQPGDADALLSALWTRLGLAPRAYAECRRAA